MAAPTISNINPTSASPGQKVVITGTGFSTATAVQFGGFDALLFSIQSATVIWAYAPVQGTGTVAVINPDGTATVSGFYAVLTRVRLPDLPDLARPIDDQDQIYVWDYIRNVLCRSTVNQLPNSGGGGGGGGGNIYTALGSPFKVRVGDSNHSYDAGTNKTIITDVRLLGKDDYEVTATDISNGFDNDRLNFDPIAGTVEILNYQLTNGRHVTIYADGVVTNAFNNYLTGLKDQIATILTAVAPFLPSLSSDGTTMAAPGGVIAWNRPAIEIPAGWAEWVPGRGRTLIGQDTTGDLSAPVGTAGGTVGGGTVLTENNIPKIQLHIASSNGLGDNIIYNPNLPISWNTQGQGGNADYRFRNGGGIADLGVTSPFGKVDPDPIDVGLSPYRIVNFIYSTITI